MIQNIKQVISDERKAKKASFLSRVFGIFREEIVKYWVDNDQCEYEDLGRPTIIKKSDGGKVTLDYTFKKGETVFIVEQKNFYGYSNGRLAEISTSETFIEAFEQWSKSKAKQTLAWDYFLNFDPNNYIVQVNKQETLVDGRILIWADYTNEGKQMLMEKLNLKDIISVNEILNDLRKWGDKKYLEFITSREKWVMELFNGLR